LGPLVFQDDLAIDDVSDDFVAQDLKLSSNPLVARISFLL
jgi:hypothetical protein